MVCVCVFAEGVCASDPEQRSPGGSVSGLDRGALPPGVGAQPAGRGGVLGLA